MNQDHTRRGRDLVDDEKVLFNLVSIRYSAVVADRLWSLFEAEHKRNDCVEAELQALKGQVALLNNRLLTVDRFSFDANKKVNTELEKDGVRLNRYWSCLNTLQDKHNALVSFVRGHLSQLELHRRGLLLLRGKMCSCAAPESPIDGSGEAPSFSSPSTPRGGSPAVEVESEDSVVVPPENETPVPVPALVPVVPAPTPHRTVVESTSTLRLISEDEARAIEDRLVGAWQQQGADNAIPITLDGLESNETSGRSCGGRVMELTQEQMGIRSPEVRGYRMLSMMRAVTMMPNSTVSACLLSSDFVGGELQLVFPISQEEFDSLVLGEMEAEVCPVVLTEVVRGGVEDDELDTGVSTTNKIFFIILALVDEVLATEEWEMPRRVFLSYGSFNDQVWQQAISSLMNIDADRRKRQMYNDESVLFQLIEKGLVDFPPSDDIAIGSIVRYTAVVGECLWSLLEHQQVMINQLEKQFFRLMSDNRVLSKKIIRLEARFDKMENVEYSPGMASQQCTPSAVEHFNSLVGSLVDSIIESKGVDSSTDVSARVDTPELKVPSLVDDPVVHRSAWSGPFVDVPLASLEGRKRRQRERLQRAKEAKASKHPVTPPVDVALEDVVVIPSEVKSSLLAEMQIVFPLDTVDFDALCSKQFDTYDVHGLYNEVVPHNTIRVDDAMDEFGRDILESVVEDDGDPDWADM
ncbi:hypothetical protein BDM02DRAFT_3190635 [Thelephora ganbajun]|uniref:Uncharacterized protein n=1 Tax=Thelephora ganbajun TaxID=370292 RepID=A0ACB6Z410_THEGA|nr:hypothetical protein BDM02DRAFT_3190635 [Thelephora ganbajun]